MGLQMKAVKLLDQDVLNGRDNPRLGRLLYLFTGLSTISVFGDWFSTVAIMVVLYKLVGAAGPGLYMIARVVPRFPGSITGALLAERWGIRRVSTWLVTLQFFSTGLLTIIFLGGGRILLWTVLVLVVFSQFGNGGVRPLLTSGLHSISGEEKYAKGLSLYNAGAGVGMVGGPVLGALLLVKSSAGIVLMCDTASFLVLILGLVCIHSGRKAEKTVWKEGVATIQRMWIQKDL